MTETPTHKHVLLCTTQVVNVNKEKTMMVGSAKCVYCEFEVDCPIKEHAHG